MIANETIATSRKRALADIRSKVFNYQMIKPMPADWTEKTIILPESTTVYPGPFSYRYTPYCRDILNHLHPSDPTRHIAVLKGSQSGLTAGVVIPGMCYIIEQLNDPILFTAADLQMAGKTIEQRLDPILRSSSLDHLIRPNVIKKGNNRTGDTKYSKEFAGGTLTALGTNSADSFRMFSARYVFADDFETAPRDLGQEGDVAKLIQGRQKSYGAKAKTYYISTPQITATSNIYEQYLRGTQKKWHWCCPACETWVPVEWSIKLDDGTLAGIVYELDSKKKLIKESIFYKTPCCGHLIEYKDKFDLNLTGRWISTVEQPEEELFESYYLNDIFIPPGFDNWEMIVKEWLLANPPGEKSVVKLLKPFNNQRLGLPFEEMGETPKSTELMQNVRKNLYSPGTVPNKLCEEDGNGKIILVTLSCDLNGIMEEGNEDVRLDWEAVAHSQAGATYSIDQGSIGTFKRSRDKTRHDKAVEENRIKWTLNHGVENSVWPAFEEMIKSRLACQTEEETFDINITAVDTGFQEKLAMRFILKMQEQGYKVYGVKGRVDKKYRDIQRDTQPVRRSTERPKQLYIVETNQMKDDLAQMMKLRDGSDEFSQPSGFMNFPQQEAGKYSYSDYFSHFEGERRIEVKEHDKVVGYYWDKKNSQSQNHFWDVRIYNLVCTHIYLDLVRQSDSLYKFLTWEEFVAMVVG
jgi:phage terminase large subunit GpA-like protein